MRKTLAFLLLLSLLCVGVVSAADSQSVYFNAGDYYDGTNSTTFTGGMADGTNTYSIAYKIRPDTIASANGNYIMSGNSGVAIDYNAGDAYLWQGDNKLYSGTATTNARIPTSSTFTTGELYSILFYVNNKNIAIYVNGTLRGNSSTANNADWEQDRELGVRGDNAVGTYFDGHIIDYTEWNQALDTTEIANWFTCGETTSCSQYFDISAVNAWNGSAINNLSAYINGTTWFHTTNGTINTYILSNSTSLFNITLNASGFVDRTYAYYNIGADLVAQLYPYNSVDVYAFDLSGNVLNNFTSVISNYTVQYENVSVNNVSRLEDIPVGDYKITVSSVGYELGEYLISVGVGSHQFVYAYLSNTSSNFTFTTQDASNNGVLSDVIIVQSVFINGSIANIESKLSDITGRAQFSYFAGVEYYFVASKTGYTTRSFPLSILYSNYFLPLEPVSSYNETVFFDDVVLTIVDYNFDNVSSWFTMNFFSPRGSLEYYSVNITTDTNSSFVQAALVGGSVVNASMNTLAASYGDVATVIVSYKSSLNSGVVTVSYNYMFLDWNSGEGSLAYLVADLISYSDFSKVFWASIFIIAVIGLFTIIGAFAGEPILTGAVGGIVATVIVGMIGLINWTVAGLTLFVFAVIVIGRMMQSG